MIFAIVVLAGACGPAGALTDEEAAPRSLVVNGDFEKGPNSMGIAAMWSATRAEQFADHVAFVWDDSVAHGGNRSMSIRVAPDHPDDIVHYSVSQYILGYEAGATYRASVVVRAENLSDSAFIVIKCYDRAMTKSLATVSNQGGTEVMGTTDWTEITLTVDVPEETGRMMILIGLAAPANRGGKAWFDDVTFVRVEKDR
jgi:hypothetical protein